jgi:xanthine dehydrogenase YagS FAD-binding subunit
MRDVMYVQAQDLTQALGALRERTNPMLLAGGTNVVDYIRTGALVADTLIDISHLPLRDVRVDQGGLTMGALARMTDVASHGSVKKAFPVVSQALELSASAQLRNMATIGGNLMQRTRCAYFREAGFACNKRRPGSGCAAREGSNRFHAILGGSEHCVATHASDLAVALMALDAVVHLESPGGRRQVPLREFYRLPGQTPQVETVLQTGEMLVNVTCTKVPGAARSHYLKIRGRASFEFALVSVAAVIDAPQGIITSARIAFGGVGTVPWRDTDAEKALVGCAIADADVLRNAAKSALRGAESLRENGFKVELGRRALVRAVRTAGGDQ